ncbi:peptidoglycan-associated lipoprotein [Desulfocicer vacuolatum DSM 3385]|uniref:Peptidoglycan-associated lipoprotein n=1 Tax=Desulfocicer vacuolatum DSM 3385 TaxID=1121400 RepID=A0A1W1ZDB9_9BACT|nr:peptidoglycan-associated lipoprotein Pal [Desulfocicer vacuolatum]SMC46439.1 peptidoglycan-associated lipoprotein [Desulfocicer vacuolatum DSM 3385]
MKKQLVRNLIMGLMVAALALTVSCAKKNVMGDPADLAQNSGEISAEEAARMAAQEKEKALAQQRLQEQTMQENAVRVAAMAAKEAREAFENRDILFGYDSAVLSAEARQLLKEKARWLEANPDRNVVVQGHCDERGTTEYNLALGDHRATAVKNFLTNMGIPGSQIVTISYGEEKPLDMGRGEDAWRKNRRAHFVIL